MLLCRAAAPIALLAAMALAGCTAPEPEPTQTVVPTDEPLFASEEEALAAAEEAYTEYVGAVNQALASGGDELTDLESLASPEVADIQRQGFEEYRSGGLRAVGKITVDSFTLQGDWRDERVAFYVCRDVSNVDVLDGSGRSVVSADRLDRGGFEAEIRAKADGSLEISRDDPWSGASFC